MLTLLLATALSSLVIPTATVHFPGGQGVIVSGPGSDAERLKYGETSAWINNATLYSPKKDWVAVRFCTEHAMESGCVVYLARASGQIQKLENSGVDLLLWTSDGRYLIGSGGDTVRLWNLSGGLRTGTLTLPVSDPGITPGASEITRLWLDHGDLCVAMKNQLYAVQIRLPGTLQNPPSQRRGVTFTTTRYVLPWLTRLTSATLPVGPKLQEAECRRVRRSD
jgi:hypothetical protein